MLRGKFEQDTPMIQQHWNNFISLVRQDLSDVYAEHRNVILEIKKLERIEKILHHHQGDISFLLSHKESILAVDSSLDRLFSILEAFNNINNLGNAVAIRTYNEILDSKKVKNVENLLNDLIERKKSLQTIINITEDLIDGVSYNKDLITELVKKHKISGTAHKAIVLYPIIKTLKNDKILKKDEPNKVSDVVSIEPEKTQNDLDEGETLHVITPTEDVSISYKENFDKLKIIYDRKNEQVNLLLNKYYGLLSEMTPTETQYYRIYCNLKDEELQNANLSEVHGEYDEVVARITAMKLFNAKNEIEDIIKKLTATKFSDKDEIEYLGVCIEEYETLCDKLQELDGKITKIEEEKNIMESKVFFLTDNHMSPFIPDSIHEKGYIGSFKTIIEKAQAGFIQQKKGSNIMPLKIYDKKFKDECGRTVFAVRNSKVIVSYIKLKSNSGVSNDGGIMILTASLLNPNTIQEATDRVIKDHCDQLLRQIDSIEKYDPQQLSLQSVVRDEILNFKESNIGEGEINGRKTK